MTNQKFAIIMAGLLVSGLAAAQSLKPPLPVVNVSVHDEQVDNFHKNIDKLLVSEEYSNKKQVRRWHRNEPKELQANEYQKGLIDHFFEWLARIANSLSGFGELASLLIKALLMVGLLLFFWWLYKKRSVFEHWFLDILPNKQAKVQGLSKKRQKADPLADDDELVGQIRQALSIKDYVLAVSLLYRSSLRAMSIDHQLPIKKSDTEAKCQRLLASAKTHYAGEMAFFDGLVWLWQRLAYGDEVPADVDGQAHALFADWQRIYGNHAKSIRQPTKKE